MGDLFEESSAWEIKVRQYWSDDRDWWQLDIQGGLDGENMKSLEIVTVNKFQ